MKALITVINKEEAEKVIKVGCDILDIKNPREGSLGAPEPWIIGAIKEIVPPNMEVSVAVGDVPNLPCTVALAVVGAAKFSPDYIKIGLKGPKNKEEAFNLVKIVTENLKNLNIKTKLVIAGFADYERIGSVNPLELPEIAAECGVNVCMIDTAIKDGKTLLDFLSIKELTEFVKSCHNKNLLTALAGSLNETHVEIIAKTGVDIFGVRGAVCASKNREKRLEEGLVENILSKIKNPQLQQN